MKRVIVAAVLLILVVLVLTLGYAFMNANSLIAAFKPDLELVASKALGAKVELGAIEISVFPSASLNIREVKIAGSAREDFSLERLKLELRLSALLKKQLAIEELVIVKPFCTLVKTPAGIRVAGLGASPDKSQETPQAVETSAPASAPTSSPLGISLKRISVENGSVLFRDPAAKTEYRINPINVSSSLALDGQTVTLTSLLIDAAVPGLAELSGKFSGTASPSTAALDTKDLSLKLNGQTIGVNAHTKFEKPLLELNPASLTLFSGTGTAKATLKLDGELPLSTSFDFRGLNSAAALAALGQSPEQQKFSATLESLKGSINAPLGGSPLQAASGTASLVVKNASVKNFNLVGAVLKSVKGLPFLDGALYDAVPNDQRGEIDGPDTVFSQVTANFSIASGALHTTDFKASSTLCDLDADGSIGFDSSIDLTATILFSPKLSANFVKKAKDLSSLLDPQGRLGIPLKISGVAPKLTVFPNIDRLLKAGAAKLLQDKAADFLGKALGGKKGGASSGGFKGFSF